MKWLTLALTVTSSVWALQQVFSGEQPGDAGLHLHSQIFADAVQLEDVDQRIEVAHPNSSELEKLTTESDNFTQVVDDFAQAVTTSAGHSSSLHGVLSALNSSASFQRVAQALRRLGLSETFNASKEKWIESGINSVFLSTAVGVNVDVGDWLGQGERRLGVSPMVLVKVVACLDASCGEVGTVSVCLAPYVRGRTAGYDQSRAQLLGSWTDLRNADSMWGKKGIAETLSSQMIELGVEKFSAPDFSWGYPTTLKTGWANYEGDVVAQGVTKFLGQSLPYIKSSRNKLIIPYLNHLTVGPTIGRGESGGASLDAVTVQARIIDADTPEVWRLWLDSGVWAQKCWRIPGSSNFIAALSPTRD